MTTATINGKPNPLVSRETPPETPVSDFAAMARAEAEQHTRCPQCQAEMIDWRLANPTATKLDAETAHAEIWEHCPPCSAEYIEWCEEVDRQTQREANSLETLEHEAYACDKVVPRVIDLTHPMPCIVSVCVTDAMIENDEIPY